MHAEPQSSHILGHHFRGDLVGLCSSVARLDNPLHLPHHVLPGVAPSHPRVQVLAQQPDVEQIVGLDCEVKEEDVTGMVEIRQRGL